MPRPCSRRWPEPRRTALVFDVDGTLAPIAPRPELARVPDKTRDEVRGSPAAICSSPVSAADPVPRLRGSWASRASATSATTGSSCSHEPASSSELARFRREIDSAWPSRTRA